MSDGGDKLADAQNFDDKEGIAAGADDEPPATWRGKPYGHWRGKLLTRQECSKVADIVTACKDARDVRLLATYATSPHGLVDDEVRRMACMLP